MALWSSILVQSPGFAGPPKAAMSAPESQTLYFQFIKRVDGPGFSQDVYSRDGTALSFTRTNVPVEDIDTTFEVDLQGVISHLALPIEPQITVAREAELKALSPTLLRMGFLNFVSGGTVHRLEISGLGAMEGKLVKLRYTDPSPTDPRKSSADAMLFFRHLLLLAPKPQSPQ